MKAFSLAHAPHLPVTGESHPLVRESVRRLTAANAVTLVGVFAFFGGAYLWSSMSDDAKSEAIPRVVNDFYDYSTPPRINPDPRPEGGPKKPPITPRELAVPDPVDDDDAPKLEFPTPDDWLDTRGPNDYFGGPIEPPMTTVTEPDTFAAFDELPQLLSIGAPVYPDLARDAGIDGTVLVKVFVTRAGKVRHAVAVGGPEVLRDPAVDAAKTAVFVPAKQGDTPVDVWVMIPVTFSLNR